MIWEGYERRKFVRAKFPCRIKLENDNVVFDTHTENISAGGIRVISPFWLKVFSLVQLSLYIKDEPLKCRGKIVWALEYKAPFNTKIAVFDVGIEFVDINENDRRIINKAVGLLRKRQGK